MAWDHHASPLNYARSVAPGLAGVRPTDADDRPPRAERTYPSFFRLPGGDLLFLYRDGRPAVATSC